MARVIVSPEARNTLKNIEYYSTQNWGEARAIAYLRQMFHAFDLLAENPELGRYRADLPPPYLAYSVGSHLIVYRYDQPSDQVQVLTLLHPAMDVSAQVRDLLTRRLAQKRTP
jgi:toxin ParE1/3/4